MDFSNRNIRVKSPTGGWESSIPRDARLDIRDLCVENSSAHLGGDEWLSPSLWGPSLVSSLSSSTVRRVPLSFHCNLHKLPFLFPPLNSSSENPNFAALNLSEIRREEGMEESSISDVNHLEADVRLPPRKRLLAGLKKQNSDCPPSPLSCVTSNIASDVSDRLRNLLDSYSNLSAEEIVDASRLAATTAAEAAAKAKAVAEEKAAIAVKAREFARSALELVAGSVYNYKKDGLPKRGRPKKHVPVTHLYKKRKLVKNNETDEDLARRLHRAMNSSSRLAKGPSTASSKLHNYKKIKKQLALGKNRFSCGGLRLDIPYTDKNAETGDRGMGESLVQVGEKSSKHIEIDRSEVGNLAADGEAEVYLTVQAIENKIKTAARKRGRIKQKKLSLSLCTDRDRENSKEELECTGLPSLSEPKHKCITENIPASSVIPSTESEMSGETVPTWKLKEVNAPQCCAGSNILRSLCSNPAVTTGSAMIEVDQ